MSRRLGAREVAVAEAVLARLVPTDERGPGAREAGVIGYVERACSEDGALLAAYADGMAALDEAARSAYKAGFTELPPERQDALLEELERSQPAFFDLVRRHALEGMFGDPAWGGNAGQAGWTLLGYPGPRLVWTEDDQRLVEA